MLGIIVFTTLIALILNLILKKPVRLFPPMFPSGFPYPLGLGSGAIETFKIPASTCFLTDPSSLR